MNLKFHPIRNLGLKKNMDYKLKDKRFMDNIVPLLSQSKIYSHNNAYAIVQESLIALPPFDPWKKK